MLVAKQLMTPSPICVSTADDPEDLLKLFIEKRLTNVPVSGQTGEIVGMLSEMALVKIMAQYAMDGRNKKLASYLRMLAPVAYVYETDKIGDVIKAMVASATHRLLVRNNAQKVVGIISPKDMLKVLSSQGAAASSG